MRTHRATGRHVHSLNRLAAATVLLALAHAPPLGGQAPTTPPAGVPDSIHDRARHPQTRADLVLVMFHAGTSLEAKESVLDLIGGDVVGGIPDPRSDSDGWYLVRLRVEARPFTAGEARAMLADAPAVLLTGTWDPVADIAADAVRSAESRGVERLLHVHRQDRTVWGATAPLIPREDTFSDWARITPRPIDPERPDTRLWSMTRLYASSRDVAAHPSGETNFQGGLGWTTSQRADEVRAPTLHMVGGEDLVVPAFFGPDGGYVTGPRSTRELELLGPRFVGGDSIRGTVVLTELRPAGSAGGEDSGPAAREFLDSTTVSVRRRWGELFHMVFEDSLWFEEELTGTVTGQASFDESGLLLQRVDSLRLSGVTRVRTPAGRSFEAPIAYAAERRVGPGDPLGALHEHWERARIRVLTVQPQPVVAPPEGPPRRSYRQEARDSLRALVEAGDTARWLLGTIRHAGRRGAMIPLTDSAMHQLLPLLDDPGRMWRMGVPFWYVYMDLVRMIADRSVTPGPLHLGDGITLSGHEVLAAARGRALSPELRDLATFAWFTLDPAGRYATLSEVAEEDSTAWVAREGLRHANGARASPVARYAPVPAREASAEEWVRWAEIVSQGSLNSASDLELFERSHPGRDIRAEVLSHVEVAASGEARGHFGRVAQLLGVASPTPAEEVVAAVALGIPFELYHAELATLMRDSPAPSDSIVRAVADRIFESEVTGTRRIEWLDPNRRDESPRTALPPPDSIGFLISDHLPGSLPAEWGAPLTRISSEEWMSRNPRTAESAVEFGRVQVEGPLVRVRYSHFPRSAVDPAELPQLQLSLGGMYMVWWEGDWRLVGWGLW